MQEDEFSGLGRLIEMGEEAVTLLTDILKDPSAPKYLRYRAAIALGEIGAPASADAIQETLEDDDPVQKQLSIRALAKIQGKEATSVLIALLDDPDFSVAKVAMQLLSEVGDETALAALEHQKTENPEPLLRSQAEASIQDIQRRIA